MQIVISFIAGVLVTGVVVYPNLDATKLTLTATEENLNNCQYQLTLAETKISGMLMNK